MFYARHHLLITIVLVLALLPGCGGGGGTRVAGGTDPPTSRAITTVEEAKKPGAWTILVYLDADNDLEADGMNNLSQMEVIGSVADVRVIVQIDRIPGYDAGFGDWTDTRRYLVIRDTNASVMSSIRLDAPALGELDMADWRTLKDFVEWGTREFPADHYCLVVWDHGSGWQMRASELAPHYKYVVSDETSSNGMNVTEIPSALSGLNVDVVAFDACLMQQFEVAYELSGSAAYMVGSAAAEPSPGYNYSWLLARLEGSTTPEQLCRAIVESYAQTYPAPRRAITQCAVDLSKITNVATAAGNFAEMLATSGVDLSGARQTAVNYSSVDGGVDLHYLELIDYAGKCATAVGSGAQASYNSLSEAMASAVVSETHSTDLAASHGVGVYVPAPSAYDFKYGRLRFATDTYWDEWIRTQIR